MNPVSISLPHASVRPLGPEELAVAKPRPRIIDVRESSEYTGELGHIPGAELVPLATVERAARDWARDEPLVVVCRSGARSAKAAATLVQLGFSSVFNLEGGTQAHVSSGLPVER
jgi:rhodanese-related sulfurtransferase